jgi:hypothetical protein
MAGAAAGDSGALRVVVSRWRSCLRTSIWAPDGGAREHRDRRDHERAAGGGPDYRIVLVRAPDGGGSGSALYVCVSGPARAERASLVCARCSARAWAHVRALEAEAGGGGSECDAVERIAAAVGRACLRAGTAQRTDVAGTRSRHTALRRVLGVRLLSMTCVLCRAAAEEAEELDCDALPGWASPLLLGEDAAFLLARGSATAQQAAGMRGIEGDGALYVRRTDDASRSRAVRLDTPAADSPLSAAAAAAARGTELWRRVGGVFVPPPPPPPSPPPPSPLDRAAAEADEALRARV